jgi:Spy/CpxP family protein refolding chaperone
MRTALEADAPDEAALMAHADRIGEITTELRKQHLRTLLAVNAQLTPEQREALRPQRGEGGHGRHGRHGGRGGHGGPGGCADKGGAEQ